MTAASGTGYAPPRRVHGMDPLPNEPPGLARSDRLILNIVRRVNTLSGEQQTRLWLAVGGTAPADRAASRWDALAASHQARLQARADRLAEEGTDPDPAEPQPPAEPLPAADPAALDRRIHRALWR